MVLLPNWLVKLSKIDFVEFVEPVVMPRGEFLSWLYAVMMSAACERLKNHRSEIYGISMGRVRLGLLSVISWRLIMLIKGWLALVASSFSDLQY